MPVKKGSVDTLIYFQNTAVSKVYVGVSLVWQQTVTPQASLMPTIAIGSGVV